MKKILLYCLLFTLAVTITGFIAFSLNSDTPFITYTVNPKKQDIKLYYKDNKQQRFGSILNLKRWVEKQNRQLVFAMNGGMYKQDHSPQGLYIEDGKTLSPTDTLTTPAGNFYLQPNGIFYIDVKNIPGIARTPKFQNSNKIKYATQSGPMLVIDGTLHPAFKQGSANVQIRNGVGILPDGSIVFAMSKEPINFYDFALYFKNLGCKNALYLDGFVSRTYLPQHNQLQTDGDFGVIIGVTGRAK